jgi:inorganic pyrophosphatase
LVDATVIGNMQMIDNGQVDDKIIAVATNDPSVNHINRMEDLPQHFLLELRNFFEQYKALENKKVAIDNFQDQLIAYQIIKDSISFYKEKFPH